MSEQEINGDIPDKKISDPAYFLWSSADDLANAMNSTSDNFNAYDGIMSSSASHRSFLNIEPNISVRPSFTRHDYYAFRPNEQPATKTKKAIHQCMDAYEKVGIIKNVIDLMGDFASQGITVNHENPKLQRFFRKWWEKVNGAERSERFLNILYRTGNVIIYKRNARMKKKVREDMSRASDIDIPESKFPKNEIPFKYDFLSPLIVEADNAYSGLFSDQPIYKMKVSNALKKSVKENKAILSTLPEDIRDAISKDKDYVYLDPSKVKTFFYKKDDWQIWANPMINAIIDDITMLEKMKLADMSALDGAISNIRLWSLGSLEHKILPNKALINKLRDILASHAGGGTMDLIWGPELTFKESNTQIYKFLGMEKYNPVLNSIYAGLGVPPTLTGLAGQSGGFTNNFISLKTLIERLEYGRDLLTQFWKNEFEHVQKALGIKTAPQLHFEFMVLSDENAQKNLLMGLADRDIISIETLRERLGESNDIEQARITKEQKARKKKNMPQKADPFHNANIDSEYAKIALQRGELSIEDVTDLVPSNPYALEKINKPKEQTSNPSNQNGRPKYSNDSKPRKQKRVLPKSNPSQKEQASVLMWAQSAHAKITDIVTPALLDFYGKKNARELSKLQAKNVERVKLSVLCSFLPFEEVNEEKLIQKMSQMQAVPSNVNHNVSEFVNDFIIKNNRNPSVDELRSIYSIAYTNSFFEKNNAIE